MTTLAGGSEAEDADKYELGLRKRDARSTLAVGVLLLLLSVGSFVAWYLLYAMGTDFGLVRNGGLVLVVASVWTLYSGLRKRARASSLEQAINDGRGGARG